LLEVIVIKSKKNSKYFNYFLFSKLVETFRILKNIFK